MRIGPLGRALWVSSLLAFLVSGVALGDDRAQFAQETGLDIDLVNLIQVDVDGTELTIVFVFINERTFESKISSSLRAALLPYLGRNALYVNPNVKSVVSQFPFDPLGVSVQVAGEPPITLGLDGWSEITPGFLQGRFEVNPAGASQGSGAEGVVVLGDAIEENAPFDVIYEGRRTTFTISTVAAASGAIAGGPSAATTSHDPIEIPLLGDVTSLEEILASPDFSSESMAALLGIDTDDVRAAEITFLNDEILRLLYVRLEEGTRVSALGVDLIATLDPLIGTGAVMVWAHSSTGVAFSPWNFFAQQSETNYLFFSSASFVDLTPGFTRTGRLEANQLSAGVIRLPKGMMPDLPYALFYGTTGVDFP